MRNMPSPLSEAALLHVTPPACPPFPARPVFVRLPRHRGIRGTTSREPWETHLSFFYFYSF